jgi:HD-GYP domain-containing protein (c-di-GMP phosphodiesterase class II)
MERSHTPMASRDPWEVLDRFLYHLQHGDRGSDEFLDFLKSICDGLQADTVFLHAPLSSQSWQAVGSHAIEREWSKQLLEAILAAAPPNASKLWHADLAWLEGVVDPRPASAALIQVSRSKRAWVVALSFRRERAFDAGDIKIMMLARRMLSYHHQRQWNSEQLKDTLYGLIYCLTSAIDAKDPYTSGHSERVARMAVRLGREMGMPESTISDLYLAGLLHDIGKIGIKDSVLQKPGELTDEEMQHVQEHPVIGDRIISSVKRLAHLRPGVRNHHEHYDGRGYPDGLAGEAIPLVARILAVADACDAMMSPRPYRRAVPARQIDAILEEGAGTQWDPEVVRHFLACRQELYSICQRGIGESVFVAVENAIRSRTNDHAESLATRPPGSSTCGI